MPNRLPATLSALHYGVPCGSGACGWGVWFAVHTTRRTYATHNARCSSNRLTAAPVGLRSCPLAAPAATGVQQLPTTRSSSGLVVAVRQPLPPTLCSTLHPHHHQRLQLSAHSAPLTIACHYSCVLALVLPPALRPSPWRHPSAITPCIPISALVLRRPSWHQAPLLSALQVITPSCASNTPYACAQLRAQRAECL